MNVTKVTNDLGSPLIIVFENILAKPTLIINALLLYQIVEEFGFEEFKAYRKEAFGE